MSKKLFGSKTTAPPVINSSTPRSPAQRGTYLAAGSQFEGRITFQGPSVVACQLVGDIEADDMVIIEETADIRGNIRAGNVIVKGKVVGDIYARDGVEVAATGNFEGVINAPKAKVTEGAEMRGSVNISKLDDAAIELSPQQRIPSANEAGNVTPLDIQMSGDRVIVGNTITN